MGEKRMMLGFTEKKTRKKKHLDESVRLENYANTLNHYYDI